MPAELLLREELVLVGLEHGQLGAVVNDVVEHEVLVVVLCLERPCETLIHLFFRELEADIVLLRILTDDAVVVVRPRWGAVRSPM
eukprot:1971692-Heterocapsa_arctica.AAC.1